MQLDQPMTMRGNQQPSHDTTVVKVKSRFSPHGRMGQMYLASGKRVAMRSWTEDVGEDFSEHVREYETVGYVISGRAELHLEQQVVTLEPGDSWVVPVGAQHRYRILEPFTAIEATSPPAHVHGRDEESP
ncbi:MAG TPA: cupin domain-containing protein [Polyangiaceae bacterium]|nr:cupin domain-containing protein [Polyangiaceae bacterium]